jgi:hypothetical protein
VTDRAGYITGLRMLADLLEQHPELPLPYEGTASNRLWIFCETREDAAGYARVLPGRVGKHTDTNSPAYGFELHGQLGGLYVKVLARREQVCERVVVGTEEITRQVPDPAVQVPMVEVTETVEKVQWRCSPLLAGPTASPAAGQPGPAQVAVGDPDPVLDQPGPPCAWHFEAGGLEYDCTLPAGHPGDQHAAVDGTGRVAAVCNAEPAGGAR